MGASEEKYVGFIDLHFLDNTTNQIILIGGASFISEDEFATAWDRIPVFEGLKSSFVADRVDADGNILDDKDVSAEVCEHLTGRSISQLIEDGRAKHQALLKSISNAN